MSITIIPTPIQVVETTGTTEVVNSTETDKLKEVILELKKQNIQLFEITGEKVVDSDVKE